LGENAFWGHAAEVTTTLLPTAVHPIRHPLKPLKCQFNS
jgi:hypothetical protein